MAEDSTQSSLLIVDDEPEIRDILCDLLCVEHDCEMVGSAEDALLCLGERECLAVGLAGRRKVICGCGALLEFSPQLILGCFTELAFYEGIDPNCSGCINCGWIRYCFITTSYPQPTCHISIYRSLASDCWCCCCL